VVETKRNLIIIALSACLCVNASGLTFWESEWNDPCKVMPPVIQNAPDANNFARGFSGKMTPFTVISCNCVITAQHWKVGIGKTLILGTAYGYPDYKILQEFNCPGDLSVFKVEKISDAYSVPFSKWIELYEDDDEPGKEVLLSSYGPIRITDDITEQESLVLPTTYQLHWGKNVVTLWLDQWPCISFDKVGDTGYIQYEAAARGGDSGSAWLIQDNNRWKLARITTTSNVGISISSRADWIYDIIEKAGEIQNLNKKYFYDTIQEAVNDADEGDVIELPQRTYTENIDFLGKALTIQSRDPYNFCVAAATIIEGTGTGDTVTFPGQSEKGATLIGITITCTDGNGIYCYNAGPVIKNCIIKGCNNGIRSHASSPRISNCRIYNNFNCGIWCIGSETTIKNNWIYDNASGIKVARDDKSKIENNTIVNNTNYAIEKGVGIPAPTISNCILWCNGQDLLGDFIATYTWLTSDGNPLFVDPNGRDNIGGNDDDDYHLMPGSTCINAGDPNYTSDPNETDIDSQTRIVGGRIDIGADEQQLNVVLNLDRQWMYQNLPNSISSNLTATVLIIDDPMDNTSYTYEWELILPGDVVVKPETISGAGVSDTFWTFAAPGVNQPQGLSNSGKALTVRVTVTGEQFSNSGGADAQFGIALLGDVNNDTAVNIVDRSITNYFWRLGAAGGYSFIDCDVTCDAAVNIADRSIVNAIWRGLLGQNSVSWPCPFR